MGKLSIGLRGWRFDESEVFTDDGELRPLGDLPVETRERLVRLSVLAGEPCNACWLIHGDERIQQCNVAEVVYGEPLHEVILCGDHEPDFVYWFREAGGRRLTDDPEAFEDAFYEWFEGGGRAPEGYDGVEHVETDPDAVPDPEPDVEMDALDEEIAALDDEELEALDTDLDDLDV